MTDDELAQVPDRVDVVVVGLGLMGSAATWALTSRSYSVVAFDAYPAGHRRGSSHGSSRIFRRAYLQADYVSMSGQALRLWRQLERAAGVTLLITTGGLDHLPGRDVRPLFDVLQASGVACTLLTPAQAGKRWPHLHFEGEVLHHPEAGVIDPELTMAETLRLAVRDGAKVLREVVVRAIEPTASGACIRLAGRTLQARRVVVAAGPWTPDLLAHVVELPSLTVTQQSVFHFARRDPSDDSSWPTVIHDTDRMVYGLPGGRDGGIPGNMKLGEHAPGRMTNAESRDGVVDPEMRHRMSEYVRHWWPGLDPEPIAAYDCLYTWTQSKDFLIDSIRSLDRLLGVFGPRGQVHTSDWRVDRRPR